ncbi:FliO/MopB family protein [Ideonella sp. BN130291]|uniref:FliO/MopB family protein n=1 Tax=Ideonella sp. BN130291 TaxID=3112940 RepID=UPI002E26F8FF|nr:flagellar biosynthetic protein FliO [Ideonella sp. BN130291]
MTSGLMPLLSFIAIIAMIPVALWLLKRTPMGGAGGQGLMRTVAVLPVSNSQRLLTVEVGTGDERRWLVLGVTAQQITTLHTMAPQADAPALQPVNFADTPFGQMLGKLKNKGGERDQ